MNRTYTHSKPEIDIQRKRTLNKQSEFIPLLLITLIGMAGLVTSFLLYT